MVTQETKERYSRKKARKFLKQIVDIKCTQMVHHKDLNPLNNEILNLEIMERSEHKKYHANLKPKQNNI